MSKLQETLAALQPRELSRLREYLYSDYHHKNEQVRLLFDFLSKNKENNTENEADNAAAFAYIFGEKARYDAASLHHVSSYLLDAVQQFLALEQWQESPLNAPYYSLKALRLRRLEKHFAATARQHQRLWQRQPCADALRFWEQYQYHSEQDAVFLLQPRRVYDSHLQAKSDNLDIFYIAEKLKIACDMTNRNIVINANYRCAVLDEIKAVLVAQPQYAEVPCIRIYSLILNILVHAQDADYQELKRLIKEHIYQFSIPEMQGICDYAQNYCIRKINSGQSAYYEEFLNLYKFQLQYHILFRNGFLEEWDYKNIVTAGIRLRDFDWTERFIRDNRNALRPAVRDNAYTYNLAAFYYATQQYRQALQQLQNVDFTDISYHLGAKIIQLKSYYELNEWAALEALADAFRLLVQRNADLSEYRRKANLNFLKLTKQAAKLRDKKAYTQSKKWEKEWEALHQKIETTQPLANAEWLIAISQQMVTSF